MRSYDKDSGTGEGLNLQLNKIFKAAVRISGSCFGNEAIRDIIKNDPGGQRRITTAKKKVAKADIGKVQRILRREY